MLRTGHLVAYLNRTQWSAKHLLVTLARSRPLGDSPEKSASIRQPHWHRHLDVKRPFRRTGMPDACEVLFREMWGAGRNRPCGRLSCRNISISFIDPVFSE